MKTSKILTVILILLVISPVYSQEFLRVKKSEFKLSDSDEGIDEAMKSIRKGNRKYRMRKRGEYQEALRHYLTAYKYNEGSAKLNYLIGVCCLKTGEQRKALKYFEEAYFVHDQVAKDILYQRGLAKMYLYEYEEAIADFEKYMDGMDPRQIQKVKMKVDKKIDECRNGIALMKKPVRCFIDNLGRNINTDAPEYSSVFFLEDSVLYFTSRRPNTTGKRRNIENGLFKEDVYRSEFRNGKWNEATHPGRPLNTKYNDAVVDLSNDGKELCVYRGKKGKGDLYNLILRNGKWRKAYKVKRVSNKRTHESSVSVTPDSLFMYFVSDRKGGQGGKDIWVSIRKQNKSRWQKPENLGDIVNTKYDEETVEVSSDGKTLYFSSKGHNSMGGYDVYKTTRNDDGTWTKPENLGYPVNTPYDDVFFMLTKDERFGYYASQHEENYGDLDLYQVTFLGAEKPFFVSKTESKEQLAYLEEPVNEVDIEKPVSIKIIQLSKVTGIVTDAYSGKPIEAKLELVDNATGKLEKVTTSYAATGKYTVTLPPGKNYALTAGAKDYFFHSENFVIADTSVHEVIHKDIQLQPMGIGAKIVLNNVFFDTGKATLRPESFSELDRLIKVLKEYPNLKLEISGHTDSRGSLSFNNKLSQRRAKSVVDYLLSKGTNSAQMVAKGYGPTQPRADNVTAEGRQLNRRVEAKILDK